MQTFEDPKHEGNAAHHRTGKPCWNKCGRPAGTRWSPLLFQPCNALRMNRIDESLLRAEEHLERHAIGPQHHAQL